MIYFQILIGGVNDLCIKYDVFENYLWVIRCGVFEVDLMFDWDGLF